MVATRKFKATVATDVKKRVAVPLPFNPDDVWGAKPTHHVTGTINGMKIRGALEDVGNGPSLVLGAAWRRDCSVAAGDKVTVVLAPEGPQRDDLAPDVAAALDAEPKAAAFFDSLAQFYRRAYLRWIDSTKRSPEERARRIKEVVALCKKGVKERPRDQR